MPAPPGATAGKGREPFFALTYCQSGFAPIRKKWRLLVQREREEDLLGLSGDATIKRLLRAPEDAGV